jgi:hypothetical protein
MSFSSQILSSQILNSPSIRFAESGLGAQASRLPERRQARVCFRGGPLRQAGRLRSQYDGSVTSYNRSVRSGT